MNSLHFPIAFFLASLATLSAQSTSITLEAVADSYVAESEPDTNFGSAPMLLVGANRGLSRQRAFVKFDMSVFANYGQVQRAWLVPHWSQPQGTIRVQAVERLWDEQSVTWNDQPSVAAPSVTVAMSSFGSGYAWPIDVTSLVGSATKGFSIQAADEVSGAMIVSGGSRENNRPARLIVQFSYAFYGTSCGLSTSVNGLPQIDSIYSVSASMTPATGGLAFLLIGTRPTDLDLSAFGLIGCSLRSSAELVVPMPSVIRQGQLFWSLNLAVPDDTNLYGASLYHQALHVDAAGALKLSLGITATILDPNR
ncbi:MAG: DNRLRE domain-containing protein [Planctomycetota bacterium]